MLLSVRRPIGPRLLSTLMWVITALLLAGISVNATAQSPWKRLTNAPPFGIDSTLLLTDGTVMCHQGDSSSWCLLTPDSTGSYVNGTWTVLPSLPGGYGPLYFASAVLPDGRMAMIGGEYNFGAQIFTNQGAIYDPLQGTWANLSAPASWPNIGDAQCVVLPNGKFMLANPLSSETAILNPANLTWSTPGVKNKHDDNDEEGWTLLPNGKLLTVDVNSLDSELFDPAANAGDGLWSLAGLVPVQLPDIGSDLEMGPQILRPDGTVICFGATGHNAVYHTATGTWTIAPDFPLSGGQQLDCADAPASILANGNVLVATSPGLFENGTKFLVWNGATFAAVPDLPNNASNPSFVYRMMVLPTGEVLVTDGSSDVEVYTAGNTPQNSWRPTISTAPTSVTAGSTYTVTGTQFNGLTQGAHYGDDAASATNYPLVRLTSHADGTVSYQRTHGHSTMAVATGGLPVSTMFDVGSDLANGDYDLRVVANGIASSPVTVTVAGGNLLVNPKFEKGPKLGWVTSPYVINNDTFEKAHTGSWKAWLCGYGRTHTDTLYQTVTLPSAVTSLTLSFWLHIDTQEIPLLLGGAHDKLTVQIRTPLGQVTTLGTFSNLDAANGFSQKMFNISAFKGKTVQIYLVGVEDRVYATNFIVDDFVVTGN